MNELYSCLNNRSRFLPLALLPNHVRSPYTTNQTHLQRSMLSHINQMTREIITKPNDLAICYCDDELNTFYNSNHTFLYHEQLHYLSRTKVANVFSSFTVFKISKFPHLVKSSLVYFHAFPWGCVYNISKDPWGCVYDMIGIMDKPNDKKRHGKNYTFLLFQLKLH